MHWSVKINVSLCFHCMSSLLVLTLGVESFKMIAVNSCFGYDLPIDIYQLCFSFSVWSGHFKPHTKTLQICFMGGRGDHVCVYLNLILQWCFVNLLVFVVAAVVSFYNRLISGFTCIDLVKCSNSMWCSALLCTLCLLCRVYK